MTEYERFRKALFNLDTETLSFFADAFSAINCNKHDTSCDKCPLFLGGNCMLFMFEVEKYERLAERR